MTIYFMEASAAAEATAAQLWRDQGFVRLGIYDPAFRAAWDCFMDIELADRIAAGVGKAALYESLRRRVHGWGSSEVAFVPDVRDAEDVAFVEGLGGGRWVNCQVRG